MHIRTVLLAVAAAGSVDASVGDRLPEFQHCLDQCDLLMNCEQVNIFQQIELQREKGSSQKREDFGIQIEPELTEEHAEPPLALGHYSRAEFVGRHDVNKVFKTLFSWDCKLDCNYKCQQIITEDRIAKGQEVVQFYGKWPFVRLFGITEFFSVAFSLGNLYLNWANLENVSKQYNKNKKHNPVLAVMYYQYIWLISVSVLGWVLSSLFHTRDNGTTETLDYVGAALIIMSNFNAITVRYFRLFEDHKKRARTILQVILAVVFLGHLAKLHLHWDYAYNIAFNMVFGLSALVLWVVHALDINRTYKLNAHVFNNSIQLLPFETRILAKMNYLGFSKTKHIPLIPVFLNCWLLVGMSFELFDFVPVFGRLLDAHAIWHLFTIFPTLIWYDWNVWDLEAYSVGKDLSKHS